MYSELRLTASHRRAFQEWEESSGVPLRVLRSRGHTFVPRSWNGTEAEACGNRTVDDCNEHGVTVVSWGTLGTVDRYDRLEVTCRELLDFERHGWEPDSPHSLYDTIVAHEHSDAEALTTESGVTWGETADRLVLLHVNDDWFNYIDTKFLTEALLASVSEELRAEAALRRRARDHERFIERVRLAGKIGLKQIEDEIATNMQQLASFNDQANKMKLTLRDAQRKLDSYIAINLDDVSVEDAEAQWERLQAHPKIDRIWFSGDHELSLDTVELDITHPTTGETVPLGKFRWMIPLSGRTGEFRVQNLTMPRGGFDHPHVNMGAPCFGELGTTLYDLFGSGQFETGIEMVFAFLATINPRDDWGRRAAFWFDPERAERERGLTDIPVGIYAGALDVRPEDHEDNPDDYDEGEEY